MTDSLDLDTMANLGEFVSAIAVVVSLLNLANQVRQSTHSFRTENFARALERIATTQARHVSPVGVQSVARHWSNFLSGNAGTSPAARPHDKE